MLEASSENESVANSGLLRETETALSAVGSTGGEDGCEDSQAPRLSKRKRLKNLFRKSRPTE